MKLSVRVRSSPEIRDNCEKPTYPNTYEGTELVEPEAYIHRRVSTDYAPLVGRDPFPYTCYCETMILSLR